VLTNTVTAAAWIAFAILVRALGTMLSRMSAPFEDIGFAFFRTW